MINILLNYDNNIAPVQDEFGVVITRVTEMTDGCYMIALKTEDDFDLIEAYMEANGKLEVIAIHDRFGKVYIPKKDKNKYDGVKYKKWLKDKYEVDENGEPTNVKLPKDLWQVNNYLGWSNREL